MKAAKWIFITFCLLASGNLFAQQPASKYKRCSEKTLNYEQGLLNNSANDLITDLNGFTWFSTITGMQRYNGYNLEQINPVIDGKINPINSPVHFFGLKDGKIWISCVQGVLEYSPRSNFFKKIISGNISPNIYFEIVPVYENGVGIYCFKKNKGIVLFKKDGQFLKSVFNESKKIDSLIYSDIFLYNSPTTKNNRYLFIVNSKNRIWRLDTQTNHCDDLIYNDEIIAITANDSKLFILSKNGLSYVLLNKMQGSKLFPDKILKMSTSSGRILLGKNNQLLVTSVNRLLEYNTSLSGRKEFITLTRKPIVSSGFINQIYTDSFKRLWLITNDDVKRIENTEVPFENFIYEKEKDNFIRSLFYDEQKHLLIAGGYQGLIQLYDTLANPLWDRSLTDANAGYILSIQKLDENNYLILTSNQGLCSFNLSSKKITPFQINPNQVTRINFGNIIQKINDSCFYYTTSTELMKCIIQKNKIISNVAIFSSDKPGRNLTSFIFTSEKNMWIGSSTGFIYLMKNSTKMSTFHIPQNYVIRCFTETADKKIWVGTDKGLYLFTNKGELIKTITRENGILNDCIYALLPDGSNAVFASTNLGISRIDETGATKNFSKELGLQESEFNTSSAIKTRSGRFFFGGVNGISAFYPESFSTMKDSPVLNLTNFIVNDVQTNTEFDTIVLKYFQNRLQFEVAALGLLNNNEYLYQYRLVGFEKNWQTTHNPTGIKYNLNPGTYTLQIMCSPALSSDNVFKKNIVIIIKSPWWKSWWFLLLAAFILIGAASLIILQYNRRKYIQKIRALETQSQIQLERERISRELHDNIGSQISFISSKSDWLIDKSEDMGKDDELEQIKDINTAAKNVMLDLRETIWTLHKKEITTREFFDKLKVYIINLLHLNLGIELKIEENIINNFVLTPIETLNLFRICQECINNILKHAGATFLKIIFYSDGKSFNILIEDNGKSFNPELKLNDHYGLENMKYRALEINAKFLIESVEGIGTTISISKNNTN